MTAREARTRALRRRRRQAQERAYREHVCGGPLVDHAAPVIGGDDLQHPHTFAAELAERQRRIETEATLLAVDFADRCWITLPARDRMLIDYLELTLSVGGPQLQATYSTHPSAPRPIPRLEIR